MMCSLSCLMLIVTFTIVAMGQNPSGMGEVSGTVIDVNGDVVPGAKVSLRRKDGSKDETTTADVVGAFRFVRVSSGSCEVEVREDRYKPGMSGFCPHLWGGGLMNQEKQNCRYWFDQAS